MATAVSHPAVWSLLVSTPLPPAGGCAPASPSPEFMMAQHSWCFGFFNKSELYGLFPPGQGPLLLGLPPYPCLHLQGMLVPPGAPDPVIKATQYVCSLLVSSAPQSSIELLRLADMYRADPHMLVQPIQHPQLIKLLTACKAGSGLLHEAGHSFQS